MATAFEGEAIVGNGTISDSLTGGGSSLSYTCPAGRYSEVDVNEITTDNAAASLQIGGSQSVIIQFSSGTHNIASATHSFPKKLFLSSNDTITLVPGGNTIGFEATYKEFLNA